ncbi:MAG: ankyrin repeat domain-containing protein [Planctomycetota bacterium]
MSLTRREAVSALGASLLSSASLSAVRPARVSQAKDPAPDNRAFLRAVNRGDLARVHRMLAEDPKLARSVDETGRSAFVLAHVGGHPAVAAALLATGLELDLVESILAEDWERFETLASAHPEQLNQVHPIGGTPVYAAALIGSLDFWRLRSKGCDAEAAPAGGTGFTPARGAMDSARISWARIAATDLLGNGGEVNASQPDGDSILHGAVRRKSELLLRLVIRKGADVAAVDAENRSAEQLATEIGWAAGAKLLADHAQLPRDHRASRFAFDANQEPIEWPDLSDVPQALQSQVTGSSHGRIEKVRELVSKDKRLVFSFSGDDELAIEASAHTGNRPLIRFHLDHGAPLSLPTAVSLGDIEAIDYWLESDPELANERGAHDFPVMWYAALGRGGSEIAQVLVDHGLSVDQHSMGTTTLHWCARRNDREFASWLIEQGANIEAVGYRWDRNGQTPLQLAQAARQEEMVKLLEDAGARR